MTLPILHRALVAATASLSLSLVAQTPAKKPQRSSSVKTTDQKLVLESKTNNGPNLDETKSFIKEKMEIWGTTVYNKEESYGDGQNITIFRINHKVTTEISFENDNLILNMTSIGSSVCLKNGQELITEKKWKTTIKIPELDINGIKKNDNWLSIPIGVNSNVIGKERYIKHWDDSDFDRSWRTIGVGQKEECWVFNGSAQIDRLMNAFKRLVELHGGKPSPF